MADDPAQAEQSPPASPPAVSTAAQLQAKLEEVRSACRDKQPRVAFDMLEEARAYCEVNCEHLDPLARVGFCEAEAEALVTVMEYAAAAQRLRDSLRVDLLPDTPLARQARLRLRLGVCHRLQAGDEQHDAELQAKARQCFADAQELCEQAASAERRVGGVVSEETEALGLEVSFELGCASERADDRTAAREQFVHVVAAAGALDADGRAPLEGLKGQSGWSSLMMDERATLARVSELYHDTAPSTRSVGGETRLWRVLAWEAMRAWRSGRCLSSAQDTWGLRLAGVERQPHDPSGAESVVGQASLESRRAAEESTVAHEKSTPLAAQRGLGESSTSTAHVACPGNSVGEGERPFALSVG